MDVGRDKAYAVPSRPGSELALRAVSGIVLAAVALLATWSGGMLFAMLWLFGAVAVAWEWLAMTRVEPLKPLAALSAVGLVGMSVALAVGSPPAVPLAILAGSVLGSAALASGGRARAWAAVGVAYAAVIAAVPLLVRGLPEIGFAAVLWIFAVVWGTDVAAFFVGRRFGGPKLWPAVSPKKTWSGGIGGLLAAVLAGPVVVSLLLPERAAANLPLIVAASAAASVASQFGDLLESALKRRFAFKDSGWLIPGHGGVMDRLDGFSAVALLVGIALAVAWVAG